MQGVGVWMIRLQGDSAVALKLCISAFTDWSDKSFTFDTFQLNHPVVSTYFGSTCTYPWWVFKSLNMVLRTRTAHMIRIACLFGMGADDQITLSQHYSLLSIWAFISSHIKALWALELVACVLQSTPVGKRDRPEKLYDDEIASLLLLFFSSGYIGCQLVRMHQNLYKIVR